MDDVVQNIIYKSYTDKHGVVQSDVDNVIEIKIVQQAVDPIGRLAELEKELESKLEEIQALKQELTGVKEISEPS